MPPQGAPARLIGRSGNVFERFGGNELPRQNLILGFSELTTCCAEQASCAHLSAGPRGFAARQVASCTGVSLFCARSSWSVFFTLPRCLPLYKQAVACSADVIFELQP